MPYVPFYEHFPELAKQETRTITLLKKSHSGLPAGEYAFTEMYCNEKECDCRRGFFYVILSRNDVAAVIAYGWESPEFYARWMGDDSPEVIEELKGPSLNMASPQSNLAPAILELLKKVVLPDAEYVKRIKRHYRMFRDRIDGKAQVDIQISEDNNELAR